MRVEAERLALHGASFDRADGHFLRLDPAMRVSISFGRICQNFPRSSSQSMSRRPANLDWVLRTCSADGPCFLVRQPGLAQAVNEAIEVRLVQKHLP